MNRALTLLCLVCETSIMQTPLLAEPTGAESLVELGREQFPELSNDEWLPFEKLLLHAAAGTLADFSDSEASNNDAECAEEWGAHRTIMAKCLAWLCTDPEVLRRLSFHGVMAKGMKVEGALDLDNAEIPFAVDLKQCSFQDTVYIQGAHVKALYLDGTHVHNVMADGLQVDGNIHLRHGFAAYGRIQLIGATIGGSLDCSGGQFISSSGTAMNANSIHVKGSVLFLEGSEVNGELQLGHATIGGNLEGIGSTFRNTKGQYAIVADSMNVAGAVLFRTDSRNRCAAEGEVNLKASVIGTHLECIGARFVNNHGFALNLDSIRVRGTIFLRRRDDGDAFEAIGGVNLNQASVGGTLNCFGGAFVKNNSRFAINADSIHVGHGVYAREAEITGGINLSLAVIEGNLECTGSTIINENGDAIYAKGATVGGDVTIGGKSKLAGGANFFGASINGTFEWRNLESAQDISLDLRFAKIGVLKDDGDPQCWPAEGHLWLHGLEYDALSEESLQSSSIDEARLRWLSRQPQKQFLPQPFEQLAKILKKQGHIREARKILIAEENARTRMTSTSPMAWTWRQLQWVTVRYGYEPWQVWPWCLGFVVLGTKIFWLGWRACVFVSTDELSSTRDLSKSKSGVWLEAPHFHAFLYSLDEFLPVINLRQGDYWLPRIPCRSNGNSMYWLAIALRVYLCIHILAGWILVTLLVGSLTGVLPR